MKDLRNMTDAQIDKALPPWRWLQIAIVWIVCGAVILFVGQFITVMVINVLASFKGWM